MAIFIKIPKKERTNLFYSVRNKLNTSFNKLYPKFNISRPMFFNYLSGKYDIPKNLFLKLEEISGLRIENFKEFEKEKYMEKQVEEPTLDRSLAEVLGILNGDGHISAINNEICVVISNLEKDYLRYTKNLFESSLKLNFRIFGQDTKVKLRTNSKKMAGILHNKYGLPKGKKLGKLKIPKKILKSKYLLIHYLRGLFDTDGSFFIRRKKDPVIEISSADSNFLKQIKEALNSLGFKAGMSGKHVYLYNKEHIDNFFKIIKPANSKHLKKYALYSS